MTVPSNHSQTGDHDQETGDTTMDSSAPASSADHENEGQTERQRDNGESHDVEAGRADENRAISPQQPHTPTLGGVELEQSKQQQQQQQQQNTSDTDNEDGSISIPEVQYVQHDPDPYKASPQSKYDYYDVAVDKDAGDRATEIKFCSWRRPHMRAMHVAYISFFLAFTIWFAPAPLLKEIADTLGLSKKEVWTSSITNDVTAIIMRIIMGPIVDNYGARWPMAVVLALASIPTACVGLVNDAVGLSIIRFFIGIAGSSFVMAQFWPSRMFAREITGTANGIVAGWGNLGGAFTQALMGSVLFPVFREYYDGDAERSWRVICVIPAAVTFCWACCIPFLSDDAPMGQYSEMKKQGTMDRILFTTSLRSGAVMNTWILYAQYACCFGVELVMNNATVLFYTSEFGTSTERAATLGFLYGSMNFFARGLGGYISDELNLRFGLRGRLWLISFLLLMEGLLIVVFARTDTQPGAVAAMCAFSVFTQSAEGAIYGVVPYVTKLYSGSVAGLVGAGGNVGSVVYGLGFRSLPYRTAFEMMGGIVMASSILSVFINIPCHAGMFFGQDNHAVIQARQRFIQRREQEALRRAQQHHTESQVGVGDGVQAEASDAR